MHTLTVYLYLYIACASIPQRAPINKAIFNLDKKIMSFQYRYSTPIANSRFFNNITLTPQGLQCQIYCASNWPHAWPPNFTLSLEERTDKDLIGSSMHYRVCSKSYKEQEAVTRLTVTPGNRRVTIDLACIDRYPLMHAKQIQNEPCRP